MNTEISKVAAEMRERSRIGSALPSYGQMQDWLDRIEAALQQPASADVEREAREIFGEEYRRTHEANPRCNFSEAEANCAIRAITAALRKQQQEAEPVAWSTIGPDGENSQFGQWHPMHSLEGFKKFAVLREGHSYVFAYTAPQSRTDLGQFREAVECWKDHLRRAWKHSYSQGHPDATAADRLLALIDAQEKGA